MTAGIGRTITPPILSVLLFRFSDDDSPFSTNIQLDDSAAGNTAVDAIIVIDGIADAKVSHFSALG